MNISFQGTMENDTNPQRLAEDYAVFVQKIASQLVARFGLSIDFHEDLVSAGYLGLVEAATRFEQGPDNKFSSFAYLRIRGAMIDHMRSNSAVPRGAFQKFKREEKIAEMQGDFLEGGQVKTLNDVVSFLAAGTLAQEVLTNEDDFEDEELLEVERDIFRRQMRKQMEEMLTQLTDNERIVINEHYFEGKTFREISDDHEHLTASWISRLHANGLKKLSVLYAGVAQ
jgi:RNA polymerase sigma factor for flagellar operon FliA